MEDDMKEDITICEKCNNDTKLCDCGKQDKVEVETETVIVNDKPLEEKSLVERHMMANGQFNLGGYLGEQEKINKDLILRVAALEEAMMFFSNWYNKKYASNIIVPEHLANDDNQTKIIL